jgi:hypothetical protein
MSTNINITVGDEGLLDRAKQQQAASRQTQLNREASVQLEAEAITALLTNAKAIASGAAFNAARTAAFAAQGRDASGNLITAPSRIEPYIAPRPAANRTAASDTIIASASFPVTIQLIEEDFGSYFEAIGDLRANKPYEYKYFSGSRLLVLGDGGPDSQRYLRSDYQDDAGSLNDGDLSITMPWDIPAPNTASNDIPLLPTPSRPIDALTLEIQGILFAGVAGGGLDCSVVLSANNNVIYSISAFVGKYIQDDVVVGPKVTLFCSKETFDSGQQTLSYQVLGDTETSGPNVSLGQWHQAALVLDSDLLFLYFNGIRCGQVTLTEPIPKVAYRASTNTSIYSIHNPGGSFSSGWTASRFTTRARYRGNYIPRSLNSL